MKKVFILFLIALSSCNIGSDNKDDRVLARVHKEYLYESDLKDIVPSGLSKNDSASAAQNFINNWIHQKLMRIKAEENLQNKDKKFIQQLEDYRNSLVIYEYQSQLLRQQLDTVVSETQIEEYYSKNPSNFQLRSNIVKLFYLKAESKIKNLPRIRKAFFSDKPDDKNFLDEISIQGQIVLFADTSKWMPFEEILKAIPVKAYNQEAFLKNNREFEFQDEGFVYMIRFFDFLIKDQVSPLSFEKDKITQIILNQRKVNLLNKLESEIYQQALKDNDFEIYTNQQ